MAGRKSDAQKERVALLLAAGRSRKESATVAGVSRRAVSLWLKEQEFQGRVRQLQGRLLRKTVGLLAGASAKAVKTLLELLKSEHKGSVRASAAGRILDSAFRTFDVMELAARLELLEEAESARGEKK